MSLMSLLIFLIKLIVAMFIIRFHANAYRLGRNPVLAKLNQLTDPVVLPFARLVRHPRFEIGALIAGLLIAVLTTCMLFGSLRIGAVFGIVHGFFGTWLDVILYSLIIVIIASWLQTDPRQPVMQIALSCNEWLMAPLRRVIPPLGMIDFSPIVALIAIQAGKYLLARLTHGIFI